MSEKIEVPKELAEKIYKLIESVKVDGKLRKGANEVTKSIEKSEAKLVIVASDVQPEEIIMHLPMISKEKQIPYVHVPSKTELGASAGLPVGTSAIAIANPGDAKRQLSEVLKSIELLKKGSEQAEKKSEPKPAEDKKQETKPEKKEEIKKKKEDSKTEEKPKEEPKPAEEKKEEKPAEKKEEEPKTEEKKE